MRDVVKERHDAEPNRRRKRRRKNLSLYYAMVIVLVVIVGIILSLTVLFNVTEIEVVGDSVYGDDQIITASKIKTGDNLIRMDASKAEDNIMRELVYIDTVNIKRVLPEKVEIEVTPSINYGAVECNSGYLLISRTGKILNYSQFATVDLPVIRGCESETTEPGTAFACSDNEKDKLLKTLRDEMVRLGTYEDITLIDISDRYNIVLVYDNRITIELGSQNDLSYKLEYSYMLVTKNISENKEGTLFMRGANSNEASFVEKSDLEKYESGAYTAITTEMPVVTDENGSVITEETPAGSSVASETAETTTTAATENLPPVGIVVSE